MQDYNFFIYFRLNFIKIHYFFKDFFILNDFYLQIIMLQYDFFLFHIFFHLFILHYLYYYFIIINIFFILTHIFV